jgi:Ni/Fe-hydrogenase subunit HybB-like protein
VLLVLFLAEVGLGVVLPMGMFFTKKIKTDKKLQLRAASLVIFGLVLNRFNVSRFGMEQPGQLIYAPSIIESLVTIGIIAAHILFFVLVAKYFPIFEHHPEATDYTIPDHFHRIEGHDHGTHEALGAKH